MLARLVMWSTYRTLHWPVITVEALTRDLLPVLAGGFAEGDILRHGDDQEEVAPACWLQTVLARSRLWVACICCTTQPQVC